jgi:diacylglycerol kinase (ATP)
VRQGPRPFALGDRLRSFKDAATGVLTMLSGQHNAWIHAIATVCVVALGLWLHLRAESWCFLVLAMVVVWVAEALNTAFEALCDVASPDFHPLVKKSKDVAAGAVLLSAIGAVVVGLLVFLPYL